MDTNFEIPGVARLAICPRGLPRYEITTPLAEAHIYLHGAQVTHFAPADQPPVLFMSGQSWFQTGKAIRGGVPVIFPWFGPHKSDSTMPTHGFARTRTWAAESISQHASGEVELVLRLDPDDVTRTLWNVSDWVFRYRIIVGKELIMDLEIENRGKKPFYCEEALHTYFNVSDVHAVTLCGLENIKYDSQVEGVTQKAQPNEPVRFAAETERVYQNTSGPYVIEDPGFRRRIVIETANSQSAIVWNPWIAKARALQDMGDDEWQRMVCVETGNVFENGLEIAPGKRHVSRTTLRSEPI